MKWGQKRSENVVHLDSESRFSVSNWKTSQKKKVFTLFFFIKFMLTIKYGLFNKNFKV